MDSIEATPTAAGRSRRVATVGLALLLALPAASRAQDIEVSGFVGWRYGGSGRSPVDFREIDIDGARSFGGAAVVPMWGRNGLGLYFSRAGASGRSALTDEPLEVTVSYLLLGIVHDFSASRVLRPFFGFSLGAAWRTETPGGTRTRLTGGAVAGIRVFPTRRLGLRADARLLVVSDDRRDPYDPYYGPSSFRGVRLRVSGDSLIQAELAIGLVVAF